MNNENNLQTLTRFLRESVLAKLTVIGILILILLIPSSWIEGLIAERAATQQSMVADVSSKWSGSQTIKGPVLVVPYKTDIKETDLHNNVITKQEIGYLYLLPENLNFKAAVKTEIFHRGIFDATVYSSRIMVKGNFSGPDLEALGLKTEQLVYDKARLVFSVSDLKGLKSNPIINVEDKNYSAYPSYQNNSPFKNGLQIDFILSKTTGFTFKYSLDVNGTDSLSFLHLGKTTDIDVSSDWNSPSFDGKYLPDKRTVYEKGFTAQWHLLNYNRPYPQQWVNDDTLLTGKKAEGEAIVNIKLHLPVDQYRKVARTAKYSSLIILLTFVSLFFTELIRKQTIHILNYILIGAAMVVYYTLLLSFSEHTGYDAAYVISSVATIVLVASFVSSLLHHKAAAFLFATILGIFYGFIYILIQMEELALLIGSISLFVIVGLLMYFSGKINWDNH